MSATTRRGFLGGALASAAVPVLGAPEAKARPTIVPAKRRTIRHGRAIAVSPKTGTIVIAHAGRGTIAIRRGGRTQIVEVGGHPVEVAVSPDGRLAAVTTGFWQDPGLALVNLRGKPSVKRLDIGPAPSHLAFTGDGRRLLVTGGEEEGEIRVIDVDRRRLVARRALGSCPRGIAAAVGDRAWVALNGAARLLLVSSLDGRPLRRERVPALPDRVAVSGNGKRLLVSHGGRDADRVTEVSVRSGAVRRHRAGRLPSGVAFTRDGRMVVALGGEGRIAVISDRGRVVRRRVGGAPRGLAIAGGRAWTADALTGKPRRVAL